jgi:predicted acyltransferase
MWLRVLQRTAMLVLLGWIVCYFRDQFANSLYGKTRWTFSFGMDVLQLLGMGYLLARVLYELSAKPRAAIAAVLLLGHFALLRLYPQGNVPRGTFNEQFNVLGYVYSHWGFWDAITLHIGPVTIGWRGLLSVVPTAATMLIGTLVGDRLRRDDEPAGRTVRPLVIWGLLMIVIGVLWAFDLPFNKPCWTPSYLMYVSGVGTVILAGLFWLIDVKQIRRWTYPLVVFGTNAIALYFCSIMFKVLFLNTPRIHGQPVIEVVLQSIKSVLGAWAGGWTFTALYITFWWVVVDQMYRRKIFWKL